MGLLSKCSARGYGGGHPQLNPGAAGMLKETMQNVSAPVDNMKLITGNGPAFAEVKAAKGWKYDRYVSFDESTAQCAAI